MQVVKLRFVLQWVFNPLLLLAQVLVNGGKSVVHGLSVPTSSRTKGGGHTGVHIPL